eukprot:scaffold5653_cov147-Cylindrotheca_fusiformis.AAC.25
MKDGHYRVPRSVLMKTWGRAILVVGSNLIVSLRLAVLLKDRNNPPTISTGLLFPVALYYIYPRDFESWSRRGSTLVILLGCARGNSMTCCSIDRAGKQNVDV